MVKIYILSSDLIFAEMLCAETLDIKSDVSVEINRYAEGGIVIMDLDSEPYGAELNSDDYIIGFSRNENSVSKSILNKCYSVIHRPFHIDDMKKLVERLVLEKEGAVLMPSFQNDIQDERLKFEKECVSLDGKRIGLSGNEYAVLKVLYENKGNPVSREALNKTLSSSEGNMCDVYICHLRSKLEKGGSEKFIYTVRGKGYTLKI